MMDRMDLDKDGLVSWLEFKAVFIIMTGEMTDKEFYYNVRKNVMMEEELQEGYLHPSKNRKYLERASINAVLSEGLEGLIREVYLHRCANLISTAYGTRESRGPCEDGIELSSYPCTVFDGLFFTERRLVF